MILKTVSLNLLDPPRVMFYTAQKIKFSCKNFFSRCDQIRSFLGIWLHLLRKFLMENFIFCTVLTVVGLAHLREHKLKCNFQNCVNSICSCGLDIESNSHFLLHCPVFDDERYILSILNKIDCKLLELTSSSLSQTLVYCNTKKHTHS